MCGITGVYALQQNFSEIDLQRMTDAISHRGPDASGFYWNEDKSIGLGHRRLSIIDLSAAANQPMTSHNGRYVMVFNGEVYNFKEIARQLDIVPHTSSDSEIILEAFVLKGPSCVHLFNGMFAIAIYDKHEKSVYLLRDRIGVKPLYVYASNKKFAFSSEIKSLRNLSPEESKFSINKDSIHSFLYAGYIPGPYTIYNEVTKLPQGSYAKILNGEITIKKYWNPQEKIESNTTKDFNAAKQELKNLLTSSVEYRMISDVPFGTFLSGGIDSSMVTALAQNISTQPVNTFSIGFKEAKFNESEYAKNVSKHLGTHHHEFIVTENDALDLIERMMTAYDEPYADSSGIPTMLVSKMARQHVTMTLSGDGGDELFLGYGMYDWAQRLSGSKLKAFRKPVASALSILGERYRRAAKVINYPREERIKSHIFSQEQYLFSEAEINELLCDHKDESEAMQFNENYSNLKRKLSVQEEQALFDINYYLPDDLLTKVDIASMQFSLEARTPFLDYRVVEFALNLHSDLKKKEGVSKYLLKELLYDYIPKHYFDRPKWGFSIPLAKWLRGELYYLLEKYLNQEAVNKCGVVRYEYVRKLIDGFIKGDNTLYNRVWALLLLHRWMLEFKTNSTT
ncbi:MAG: asparagine synthase (glutamine-hydrolyzing) [Bacteroidetes bacterium]|nr:asparagine synthase (glutamine-hydrolyzing) [Bacteroidota bacterium]